MEGAKRWSVPLGRRPSGRNRRDYLARLRLLARAADEVIGGDPEDACVVGDGSGFDAGVRASSISATCPSVRRASRSSSLAARCFPSTIAISRRWRMRNPMCSGSSVRCGRVMTCTLAAANMTVKPTSDDLVDRPGYAPAVDRIATIGREILRLQSSTPAP